MRFVADESCPGPVVRELIEVGHDVVVIAQVSQGATDEEVLDRALKDNRVLITEDRDFGELVYAQRRSSAGVILLRFHNSVRRTKAATVVQAVSEMGPRLQGAFTVVEPGRVRISTRP